MALIELVISFEPVLLCAKHLIRTSIALHVIGTDLVATVIGRALEVTEVARAVNACLFAVVLTLRVRRMSLLLSLGGSGIIVVTHHYLLCCLIPQLFQFQLLVF